MIDRRAWTAIAAAIAGCIAQAASAEGNSEPFEYGTDGGEYANDGECDDPRFIGPGVSPYLVTDNIGLDASDCRAALQGGTATANPLFLDPASAREIDFGDNEGEFAHDGECDDIRFTGDYAAETVYIVEDIGHDASDCFVAVNAGTAHWQGGTATPVRGVELND